MKMQKWKHSINVKFRYDKTDKKDQGKTVKMGEIQMAKGEVSSITSLKLVSLTFKHSVNRSLQIVQMQFPPR